MITAANGKQLEALQVFSAAINFLKEHFLENINSRNAGNKITVDKVRWVLTVPAIWNDSAKQMMRESSIKVKQLTIYRGNQKILERIGYQGYNQV